MRRFLGALALLAALVAGLASAPLAGQQALDVRIDSADASAFPAITLTTTVDDSGRPVTGLTPESFAAVAAGADVPLTGVSSSTNDELSIGVVLAFDVSGSMQGLALQQAKEAGKALVTELAPGDSVSILAFSDDVVVVQPFTSDRGALVAAIDGLVASGNTALYEAVAVALRSAEDAGAPRRAVVLLSDGQDFGGVGQTDRAASLQAVRTSAVPIFLVGLGESIDRVYLEELAAAASGRLSLAPSPDVLQGLYQSIGSLLRNQYVLTLDGSALPRGETVTIALEVAHSGATATAEVSVAVPGAPPAPVLETPAPTPAVQEPVAEPEPAGAEQTEQSGGAFPWPLLVGGLLAAGVGSAGLAVVLVRRRRTPGEEVALRRPDAGPAAAGPPAEEAAPAFVEPARYEAWLELTPPGNGERFAVGDDPITVGFTRDCSIRLEDGKSTGWERVRVWRREGRYMLHNLSRIGSVSVAGRPVTWAVLEDGDEIRLGPRILVFRTEDGGGE